MSADENKETSRDDRTEVEQLRAEIVELQETIGALQSKMEDVLANIEGVDDIQGDENVTPANGFIEMDRSVPSHPVIRFRADRLWKTDNNINNIRPFDILYFSESKEWKIYLPIGCVMVGRTVAYYEDGTDGSEMAVISPANTLWAHVWAQGDVYSFTIDGVAGGDRNYTKVCDFRVASFDSDLTKVLVQYASSMVNVGGGYACGDDSNITFTMCDDPDDSDRYGKMMVDVYYK